MAAQSSDVVLSVDAQVDPVLESPKDHNNDFSDSKSNLEEFELSEHNDNPHSSVDHHHHHHQSDGDDTSDYDPNPDDPLRPRQTMELEFPNFSSYSGPEVTGLPTTPDMNVYQQKKTIAQGMMDLALISANANQFRYVLQSRSSHPYYYPSLAMIGTSLLLQVVVGIGLIWNSTYNVKDNVQMHKANRANNWTVIAIFLVTILNVFISSFGVVDSASVFSGTNV